MTTTEKRRFTEDELARIAGGEPVIYREYVEQFRAQHPGLRALAADTGADPPRAMIPARLLAAIDRLGDALAEYAVASAVLAEAAAALYEAKADLAYYELDFRAKRYAEVGGVPGKNEAERKVNLDLAVMDDEDLSEARRRVDAAHHAHLLAEHQFRTVDAAQKGLREIVKGLGIALDN